MNLTARDIAQLVGGELVGNPDQPITGVAGIREAQPGDLAFIASPKYYSALKTTQAAAVIVARDARIESGSGLSAVTKALIRVDNPVAAFTQIVLRVMPPPVKYAPGIHPTAVIAPTAKLGKDVSIQPHAVIEPGAVIGDRTAIGANTYIGHGCAIGTDCLLYANVTLREYTVLGNRVILHPGVVLGADGFGYETANGKHQKIPQVGIVEIGDDVEIGANSAVDRARFGKTRVGRGTKIDNLVQIAHNCVIGEDCIICGQAGMAGSTILGKHVTMAGQVGLSGHIIIGDGAVMMGQTGVAQDVAPGAILFGSPGLPHRTFKRSYVAFERLPELAARVRELEKLVAELQAKLK